MPIYRMLKQLIPTKSQWRSWTLPSRLTAIGTLVGVIGIVLTLILSAVDNVTEHGPDPHELALNLLKNANCGTLDSMKDTQQITDDITDTIKRVLQSEGDIYKDAAIKALQNNRPLEAADLFEKSAKLRSDKAQIMSKEAALDWVDVARIYELCDPRKAMFAYKQAADLDPHNATAWNGLGLLYMNVDNHKAKDAFHKAIDNAGNNDDVLGAAYGNLGIVYTHLGDLGAAETSLRESLRIDEANDQRGGMANQYLNLGNVYLQREDLKKAEELFHKSLSIRKDVGGWTGMSVAYNQLGVTYSLMGNDREAERMYGEAVRIEVANRQLSARTLFNHALAAFRNGEIDMAEAGLVMAQKLRNSDSRVTPEAKHVFTNLILRQLVNIWLYRVDHISDKESDEIADNYYMIVTAYEVLDDVTDREVAVKKQFAKKALNIYTRRMPTDGPATYTIGRLYLISGEIDKAKATYDKLERLEKSEENNERRANAYADLGRLYLTRNEYDAAEKMFLASLEIDISLEIKTKRDGKRRIAVDHENIGKVLSESGKFDEAKAVVEKALAINQTEDIVDGVADNYQELGKIYLREKKYDDAEYMYGQSLGINEKLGRKGDMARIYNGLGSVKMGRKQLDEAKTLYDKALEGFMGIGDQEGIAAVYANLGMVYEEGEELQQATSSYQRSAEAYEAMGNQAQAEMVKELLRKVRGDQKRK